MEQIHKFRYYGEGEVVPNTYDRILKLKNFPYVMKKFGAVPFWGSDEDILYKKAGKLQLGANKHLLVALSIFAMGGKSVFRLYPLMDRGDLSDYASTIPVHERMTPCALLSERDFIQLVREIAEGMDCLHHALKFTHGDLKPCNIGVDSTLGFQIIDFEDCRPVENAASHKYVADIRRFQTLIQYCLAAYIDVNSINKFGYIHPSGYRAIQSGALAPYYNSMLIKFVYNEDWGEIMQTCTQIAEHVIALLHEQ